MKSAVHAHQPATIALQVETLDALFDALDPFPTPTRDLAPSAETFILEWAREIPREAPLHIVVHAPAAAAGHPDARYISEAMSRHFSARAAHARRELRALFRMGRTYLAVGLMVLALSIGASQIIASMAKEAPLARFISEGLILLGWVANWRPMEVFLYDWRPLKAQQKLFERLAQAPVAIERT
jgi:hypothetical protein